MTALWVIFAGSFAVVVIAHLMWLVPASKFRRSGSGLWYWLAFHLHWLFCLVGGISGIWLAVVLDATGMRWAFAIVASLMLLRILLLVVILAVIRSDATCSRRWSRS